MLLHTTLTALIAAVALGLEAGAVPTSSSASSSSNGSSSSSNAPIVDLGMAGKWKGVVQNNGTVHSWKAIPYAAPPVGDLRFKAPRALAAQNSSVQDVSADFDGQPTACVQFGTSSFVGVNAGPGQEDCLKLWIWAPAGAKKGDRLPAQVYTHGGGMQNSQSPNNDFADWVGQDQGFIAVNANFRLGALGFFNSEGAAHEGEPANVGLLDSRFAVDWVKANIAKFGGDPNNIAISGQSGGGGAIMTQLILYDGKKPNFDKAIPRSIQNYASYPVKELTPRNDAFAASLNCTDSASTKSGAQKQLACLRKVPAETIRLAALDFGKTKQANGFSWQGWLPSIDGKTLTDQPVRLFHNGKVAKVPVMAAHVTNEIVRLNPHPNANFTALATTTVGSGIDDALLSDIERIYSAPSVNASADTNTYKNEDERGYQFLNDNAANGGAYMVTTGYAKAGLPAYTVRFNSPYYLQNATSTMNATQEAVAYEWRAYVKSFIKHSDPNKSRLPTSPVWHPASSEYRYLPRLVVSQALVAAANETAPTTSGMEVVPANEWDRLAWWMSEEVAAKTRQ
ncbi:hypothetical protein JCM8097_003199 [Rhodosporidiobolus ruineniae]